MSVNRLHETYFLGKEAIHISDIEKAILISVDCKTSRTDFPKLVMLYILATFLNPNRVLTLETKYVYMVDHPEAVCNDIPWGKIVHNFLFESLYTSAMLYKKTKTHTYLNGCAFALQIWAFEHVPNLLKSTGKQIFPRYLRYPNISIHHRQYYDDVLSNPIYITKLRLSNKELSETVVDEIIQEKIGNGGHSQKLENRVVVLENDNKNLSQHVEDLSNHVKILSQNVEDLSKENKALAKISECLSAQYALGLNDDNPKQESHHDKDKLECEFGRHESVDLNAKGHITKMTTKQTTMKKCRKDKFSSLVLVYCENEDLDIRSWPRSCATQIPRQDLEGMNGLSDESLQRIPKVILYGFLNMQEILKMTYEPRSLVCPYDGVFREVDETTIYKGGKTKMRSFKHDILYTEFEHAMYELSQTRREEFFIILKYSYHIQPQGFILDVENDDDLRDMFICCPSDCQNIIVYIIKSPIAPQGEDESNQMVESIRSPVPSPDSVPPVTLLTDHVNNESSDHGRRCQLQSTKLEWERERRFLSDPTDNITLINSDKGIPSKLRMERKRRFQTSDSDEDSTAPPNASPIPYSSLPRLSSGPKTDVVVSQAYERPDDNPIMHEKELEVFDPKHRGEEFSICVGDLYPSKDVFHKCLKDYEILQNFELKPIKTSSMMITARCAIDYCLWRIHASKLPVESNEITFALQIGGWKGCSLDLEVMYYKYLDTCQYNGDGNINFSKEQDLQKDGITIGDEGESKCDVSVELVSKKKRKRRDRSDIEDDAVIRLPGLGNGFTLCANNSNEKTTNEVVIKSMKSKEKEKNKLVSDSIGENTEQDGSKASKEPADDTVCERQWDESKKKSKDKKKMKSNLVSETPDVNIDRGLLETLPKEIIEKPKDIVSSQGKSKTDSAGMLLDVTDVKSKDSRKKNNKLTSDSEIPLGEKNVKSKDNKRKKNRSNSAGLCGGNTEVLDQEKMKKIDSTNEDLQTEQENAVSVEEKGSKKIKRLTSEDTKSQPDGIIVIKEVKKSKTKDSEEDIGWEQPHKGNGSLESGGHARKKRKTESGQVDSNMSQETSLIEKLDGQAKRNPEKNEKEGSATQKALSKQHNGSNEVCYFFPFGLVHGFTLLRVIRSLDAALSPKTVNAFQRVKIDEVEFVDERLQDNSYWAKVGSCIQDGADIGYGAKAQEVLGQVRGRDFRHEKTKKKRGSYRGGQIDLHSHSIKFNYSDEE
ncbi:hypothetical protein HHK36_013533 [Tetracentron sinense]|uniref:Uncharacterized protein n=1 Tax=Tetracentron sinense TaxID=13715 RepID=A0A834ZAJ2_TETSI|nr:hypothetical protein HHK36_013533 [Tetracentron sinense]